MLGASSTCLLGESIKPPILFVFLLQNLVHLEFNPHLGAQPSAWACPGAAVVPRKDTGWHQCQGGDAEQHQDPSPWKIRQTTSFFLSFL